MIEMQIVMAGPASINEEVTKACADGTWEIKGCVSSSVRDGSPMIRVFLQRIVSDCPDPEMPHITAEQLEDLGQLAFPYKCKEPRGVIGSNKCMTCGGVIHAK